MCSAPCRVSEWFSLRCDGAERRLFPEQASRYCRRHGFVRAKLVARKSNRICCGTFHLFSCVGEIKQMRIIVCAMGIILELNYAICVYRNVLLILAKRTQDEPIAAPGVIATIEAGTVTVKQHGGCSPAAGDLTPAFQ
jgi:hypothetical protein